MTRKSKEMTPKDSRPTNCAFFLFSLLTWLVFSFCFSVTRVGAASSVEKSVLEIHNKYRAMAGLQLLQWDTALQQTASERAKQLGEASKCLTLSPEIDWQTIDVLEDGENLFQGEIQGRTDEQVAQMVCNDWYLQSELYEYPGALHFLACHGCHVGLQQFTDLTQMMWWNTSRVGCAVHRCTSQHFVFVCRYDPVGNIKGEPVFVGENYVKLCESGQSKNWKTCNLDLQDRCGSGVHRGDYKSAASLSHPLSPCLYPLPQLALSLLPLLLITTPPTHFCCHTHLFS